MLTIELRRTPDYLLAVLVPQTVYAAAELFHAVGVSLVEVKRELKSLVLAGKVAGGHADKARGHAQSIIRADKPYRRRKKLIGMRVGFESFF